MTDAPEVPTDSPAPSEAWLRTADRIELVATIIMAAAAILTAWAAFQSAKWSGVQATEFSRASAARIESTRFETRAGQLTSIDVDVFLSWLSALNDEIRSGEVPAVAGEGYTPTEGTLSAFLYQRMRAEAKPAFDAWIATRPLVNEAAPATPFQMDEYVLVDRLAAEERLGAAEAHTDAALSANANADAHVLTAVALALAIFFAGISSKLIDRRNRRVAIILSAVIFLGAALVLAYLPKVQPFS